MKEDIRVESYTRFQGGGEKGGLSLDGPTDVVSIFPELPAWPLAEKGGKDEKGYAAATLGIQYSPWVAPKNGGGELGGGCMTPNEDDAYGGEVDAECVKCEAASILPVPVALPTSE
eukprot:8660384-Karenia_brevis.AAC.1